MASYTEEYKKRNQTKMQDRDAYIGSLEEKVKVMTHAMGDVKLLSDRLTEVSQQVASLDGKVVHLTKLHRLGQNLLDSQDEEYNKDKQFIFQKLEKLETNVGDLATQLEKQAKDLFQEGAIERLDNETKWLKKQLQSKHAALSDMIQKEITDISNRDRQSLQKLEDLADVVQHEVRRREGVESEIIDLIQALKDNSRKLEEQVGQQEIKLLGKIKNSDENNRMDLDDSVRLLQNEMRTKNDEVEKRMKDIDRERHTMQEKFEKLSSTLSESNHSLSSAQHSLQRETEEMLREIKRDRGRIDDTIMNFRDEAKETKREQLHLAEELMERVQETLRRQQTENLNFESKDVSKFERGLERVFEELDQVNMKQKILDKTLQKLTLAQTTLWGDFEQELVKKMETLEQQQNIFISEISQKVEEDAKSNKMELAEAAKIEKRTALRVEDCLEQVSGLSTQVHQFLQVQEPQAQTRMGSPDASKLAAMERKMKESIYKLYDDLRANNDSFHQDSRELFRNYDLRISECTEQINLLVDSNAKTRAEIQNKLDKCVKAVNSIQSEQLNISKIAHSSPEYTNSLNVSALKNILSDEKSKTGNRNSNTSYRQVEEEKERVSPPKRKESNESEDGKQNEEIEKRVYKKRMEYFRDELTKSESEEKETEKEKEKENEVNRNERESSFSRPFDYRGAQEQHTTDKRNTLKSSFDARLALTEELARKTFGDNLDRSYRKMDNSSKTERREERKEILERKRSPHKVSAPEIPSPPSPKHNRSSLQLSSSNQEKSARKGTLRPRHSTSPSKKHLDEASVPPSFHSLGIRSPPPAPIGHTHFHKKPRSVTPPQKGKSPRVISPPRVSPMLAKLQTAAKGGSPTKGQTTTAKSLSSSAKNKPAVSTKPRSQFTSEPEKESSSLKGVSSPSQEKQTQRRLRDLYRELKALNYDADEL